MFNSIPMIQNSITATSEAMSILASDAQAFQTDGHKQLKYAFTPIYNSMIHGGGGQYNTYGVGSNTTMAQGVTLIPMGYDMSQGGIKSAGPLNAAIDGSGFFVLEEQSGSQQYALTRASNFIFSADGTLTDVFGRKVKGYPIVNGVADKSRMVPIQLDPNQYNLADVGFEDNGVLTTNYQARLAASKSNEELLQEGSATFQLAIATVPNPSQMRSVQGNAFVTTLNSGNVSHYGVSNDATGGRVIGGSSESSNVNPAETTIKGIQLQRGYNAVQAALTMANRFITQIMEVVSKA